MILPHRPEHPTCPDECHKDGHAHRTDRVSAQQVAHRIGVSRPTVWRWQQRFAESGVDGLLRDKTRKPGKPPIAAETTARVVA